MPEFNELWTGGPFFAQAEHFRLSTDSVLLADFANINGAKRGIDLGCASGIAALLLLCRAEKLHMTGLEIVPAAAELARENMERNGLGGRSEMLCGDIRDHRSLFCGSGIDCIGWRGYYLPEGTCQEQSDRTFVPGSAEGNGTAYDD